MDRHGDVLYRYALLRLRSPDLAADVVQETFLDALRARESFSGRSRERTWLVGILRHKILDHFRRSGRGRSSAAPVEMGDGPDFDHRGRWRLGPASWEGEPDRELEAKEFWDVFNDCLSKDPAGLADAFFLREIDGLGAEEVRLILGITPANLWAWLHRARSLLRGCLEANWFRRRETTTPPPLKSPSRT